MIKMRNPLRLFVLTVALRVCLAAVAKEGPGNTGTPVESNGNRPHQGPPVQSNGLPQTTSGEHQPSSDSNAASTTPQSDSSNMNDSAGPNHGQDSTPDGQPPASNTTPDSKGDVVKRKWKVKINWKELNQKIRKVIPDWEKWRKNTNKPTEVKNSPVYASNTLRAIKVALVSFYKLIDEKLYDGSENSLASRINNFSVTTHIFSQSNIEFRKNDVQVDKKFMRVYDLFLKTCVVPLLDLYETRFKTQRSKEMNETEIRKKILEGQNLPTTNTEQGQASLKALETKPSANDVSPHQDSAESSQTNSPTETATTSGEPSNAHQQHQVNPIPTENANQLEKGKKPLKQQIRDKWNAGMGKLKNVWPKKSQPSNTPNQDNSNAPDSESSTPPEPKPSANDVPQHNDSAESSQTNPPTETATTSGEPPNTHQQHQENPIPTENANQLEKGKKPLKQQIRDKWNAGVGKLKNVWPKKSQPSNTANQENSNLQDSTVEAPNHGQEQGTENADQPKKKKDEDENKKKGKSMEQHLTLLAINGLRYSLKGAAYIIDKTGDGIDYIADTVSDKMIQMGWKPPPPELRAFAYPHKAFIYRAFQWASEMILIKGYEPCYTAREKINFILMTYTENVLDPNNKYLKPDSIQLDCKPKVIEDLAVCCKNDGIVEYLIEIGEIFSYDVSFDRKAKRYEKYPSLRHLKDDIVTVIKAFERKKYIEFFKIGPNTARKIVRKKNKERIIKMKRIEKGIDKEEEEQPTNPENPHEETEDSKIKSAALAETPAQQKPETSNTNTIENTENESTNSNNNTSSGWMNCLYYMNPKNLLNKVKSLIRGDNNKPQNNSQQPAKQQAVVTNDNAGHSS